MTNTSRALCAAALLASSGAAWATPSGPFEDFAGTWSAEGYLTTDAGSRERLRCRVGYDVSGGGTALYMRLTCASDATRIALESSVRESGGSLSGSFAEATRGVQGSVSGTVADGIISARVDGVGFSASLQATARGRKQTVSIVPQTSGSGIRRVSLTLTKR